MTGSLLYYDRGLDHTILPALNEIASHQEQPTQQIIDKSQHHMDYVHIYPNAYIRYYVSDMILNIDSDVASLVAPKSLSRVAGYYHLLANPKIIKHPRINGAIHIK